MQRSTLTNKQMPYRSLLTGFSAYRQAISTGVQFSFQPLMSILRSEKLLPLQYLGGLTVELHLAPVSEAFNSHGATAPTGGWGYQLSGLKYVVDIVTMDEHIESL